MIFEILLYLAAAALRLVNLGSAQLWYDESFTYLVTIKDLPGMFAALVGDVHPPLYYLLEWPIAHLAGLNEFWLRLPSALLGLVAIWLTGRLAGQLQLSQAAKRVAQVLVAILPMELYFSQEARMYAIFQVLVLACLLYTLRRNWSMAMVTGALVLYTHNYGLFYWALIGLIAVFGELYRPVILDPNSDARPGDECQLSGAVRAWLAALVVYLPWQLVLFGQMANVAAGYWISPVTPGMVAWVLNSVFWHFYIPAEMVPLSAQLTFMVLLYAIIQARHTLRSSAWRMLLLLGLAPLLLAVAASLVWKPVLLFRGLFPSLPFLCLLIGSALTAPHAFKLAYTGMLFIPFLLGGVLNIHQQTPESKSQTIQELEQARRLWQPGDLVVHTNSSSYIRWAAYGPDLPQVLLPPCDQRNSAELSDQVRQALEVYRYRVEDAGRLWVVWDVGPTTTPCELERAAAMVAGGQPVTAYEDGQFAASKLYLVER